MRELTDKDFYYCYDRYTSNYLKSHGQHYLLKAKSIKDDCIFTVYQRTEQLEQLIEAYYR